MPRETLTLRQIVLAAVDLLDQEGIDGLSMRRLGANLGAAATAVYWHVPTKDALIVRAAEHVWAEIELPDADTTDWRAAVTELADQLLAMVTRHPWLITAMSTHLLYGHGKARFDDHLLGLLETTGCTESEADLAAMAVVTSTLGTALGASADAAWRHRLGRSGSAGTDAVIADIEAVADAYPRLRARKVRDQIDVPAPTASPHPSLDIILDGIEKRLTEH